MNGIVKIVKKLDENGIEIEVEVTEYPDIPVIVVKGNEDEDAVVNNNSISDLSNS